MSRELGMSPEKLVKKYCEVYAGEDSRVPIVRVKPKGHVKRCPLLKDRKCSVHKSKPSVCALFPIGRILQVGDTEGNIRDVSVDDVQYIFSTPGCGDATERHTVRGWLGVFGIPLQDEFFIMWQKIIVETSMAYRRLEMKASPHVMQLAWQACFKGLYLHYDTGEDFLPQFEENAQSFRMKRFFILRFTPGSTETVLEMVDGFFHISPDLIGGIPSGRTPECTGIGAQVFLGINRKHPASGGFRTGIFTVADAF
ncbi:hypothetical protein C806_04715 [Lachnospiraceae bacterium 3-1]|nr:hypothetical protein C806_04715 [Lachnospiraceae bacterium 3-1]